MQQHLVLVLVQNKKHHLEQFSPYYVLFEGSAFDHFFPSSFNTFPFPYDLCQIIFLV